MSDATSSGNMSRVEQARRRYNLIGGSILTAASLVLLATSFLLHNPVPLTVRAAIIIFAAVSIAISSGLLRVQNPQDVYGGMALILLALTAYVAKQSRGMPIAVESNDQTKPFIEPIEYFFPHGLAFLVEDFENAII